METADRVHRRLATSAGFDLLTGNHILVLLLGPLAFAVDNCQTIMKKGLYFCSWNNIKLLICSEQVPANASDGLSRTSWLSWHLLLAFLYTISSHFLFICVLLITMAELATMQSIVFQNATGTLSA